MIPKKRPVLGSDLLELQKKLDASTAEMHYILRMTPNEWADTVNAGRAKPITSIPVEIIVRVLDEFPELSPIPPLPDPKEVYEIVKGVRDIPASRFAVLCGSEKTAAVRWFTQEGRQHPKSSRVLELLSGRLKRAANPRDQADRLYEWEQMVKNIGLAREVADVTAAGSWSTANADAKTAVDSRKKKSAGSAAKVKKSKPQAKRTLKSK